MPHKQQFWSWGINSLGHPPPVSFQVLQSQSRAAFIILSGIWYGYQLAKFNFTVEVLVTEEVAEVEPVELRSEGEEPELLVLEVAAVE